MHTFLSFIKNFRIPKKAEIKNSIRSFSKKSRSIFIVSVLVALISFIAILSRINEHFLVEIPADGGSVTEGIVGSPTFVNPVLALSDADKDLTAIVYSGLMRRGSDGSFIPDLADSYTVSPDGMTYTFILKDDIVFHDGTPVTADDVLFTINTLKDPLIKSPHKVQWDGVTVDKKDDRTVVFTLKQPYVSFMDNTIIGILPMHIWKNVSATEFSLSGLNQKAVGSGPYQIDSISKNKDGIPEVYTLKRFDKFVLGMPHIKWLTLVSYANEKDLIKALLSHNIDQASSLSPENAKSIEYAGYTIHTTTLPRMFGLFFNSSQNKIFADQSVIRAFDKALDRQALVDTVLSGYGTVIDNPIPESLLPGSTEGASNVSVDQANQILDTAGWKLGADGVRTKGTTTTATVTKKVGKKTVTQKVTVAGKGPATRLSFTIITGDDPELTDAANLIKEQLGAIGAEITIRTYETGPLGGLIRSRNYEALFFGQVVNQESDLFAFWHSSQRNDPGLNIALYSNPKVDAILESAQKTPNRADRIKKYADFANEFDRDLPALFIYSPKYLYATKGTMNHLTLGTIVIPSDRFASIYTWYADTDHVWKIFTQ